MGEGLRKHYSAQAARRSFRHFFLGKGFKIVGTFATLLILARWLSTAEYAVYISLRALIEVARPLTSVGVAPVLLRFLPELRAANNNASAYRLLLYGVGVKVAAIAVIYVAAAPFLEEIGVGFNLDDWLWLIPWVLVVGALDFLTFTLSQALESFLWQKEAQYSLAAGNFLQMALLLLLVMQGDLTLSGAVLAEGCGLGFALVWLVYGLYHKWKNDEEAREGDTGWLRSNRPRLLRFAAWSYGLNLTSVGYGPGPNRLVAAYFLPSADVATYGFAGQTANIVRRLMPTRLVVNFIRPLLFARFTATGNFEQLVDKVNLVYRLNLSILVIPAGMLLVGGQSVFDWLTAGKYGSAAPLLAGLLLVLVSEGMRTLLEMIVQAVEKNHIFAGSNLFQSASLLTAIPLVGSLGPWALVVANFVGTIGANVVLIVWLRRYGFVFRVRWGPVTWICAYALVAGATGIGVSKLSATEFLESALWAQLGGMMVFLVIFCLLFFLKPPFSKSELELLASVLWKRRERRANGGFSR